MTWGKVDDQFHAHRKAKVAWKRHPRALGLHLLALSYCAGQLTDGLVDEEFVEEKIPAGRDRNATTAALVEAGLWAVEDGGWRINDWLEYNPSRADVLAKRQRDAARKARGRGADSPRNPDGLRAESKRSPNGVHEPHAGVRAGVVPAVPDPTNPLPPQPPRGGRDRDRVAYEGELAEFVAEHFPGIPPGYVEHYAGQLRFSGHEPTLEALRPLVEPFRTEAPA